MKPYKGYLLETVCVPVETSSGLMGVPPIVSMSWSCRGIRCSDGDVVIFLNEEKAKLWIDEENDPTGREKVKNRLVFEIAMAQNAIDRAQETIEIQKVLIEKETTYIADKREELIHYEVANVQKTN